MTSEEQEIGSRKYSGRPCRILRLHSGRIAVLSIGNPPETLGVFDAPAAAVECALAIPTFRQRSVPPPDLDLDLNLNIDLGDL